MVIRSISVFDQLQRLILIRHGEAQVYAASDHERTLTFGGIRSLDRTKELLKTTIKMSQNLSMLNIWVSDASRTLETWEILKQGIDINNENLSIQYRSELYLATPDFLHSSIIEADMRSNKPFTLMIIGHNPGLSQLVSELTSRPCSLTTGELVVLMPDGTQWIRVGPEMIE